MESLGSFVSESLYLIFVFVVFCTIALARGRQTVTNIILGLYLGLLLSIQFPYYNNLTPTDDPATRAAVSILIFGVFTFVSTWLFIRVLPREYNEGMFEGLGRKLLLALSGTVLIMIFSYHVLPITEFINPGSPINYLFGSPEHFFWWLVLPVVVLFWV